MFFVNLAEATIPDTVVSASNLAIVKKHLSLVDLRDIANLVF